MDGGVGGGTEYKKEGSKKQARGARGVAKNPNGNKNRFSSVSLTRTSTSTHDTVVYGYNIHKATDKI